MTTLLLPADPPLAFLESLGPALLVLFWVVRAILSANAEAKVRREQQGEVPVEGDAPQDDPVRSELEEFLKRVRQQQDPEGEEPRAEDGVFADVAPGARPAERVVEVFDDEPDTGVGSRRRRPLDPFEEPAPRRREPLRPAEPASSLSREPRATDEVARLEPLTRSPAVRPQRPERTPTGELGHLHESQLAEQAAHLGEGIASSDDRLQERLNAKFGKSVATQDAEHDAGLAAIALLDGGTQAERIAAVLASPRGVRDAIVLNEILSRPVDRW